MFELYNVLGKILFFSLSDKHLVYNTLPFKLSPIVEFTMPKFDYRISKRIMRKYKLIFELLTSRINGIVNFSNIESRVYLITIGSCEYIIFCELCYIVSGRSEVKKRIPTLHDWQFSFDNKLIVYFFR